MEDRHRAREVRLPLDDLARRPTRPARHRGDAAGPDALRLGADGEGDNVIALKREGGSITLEPGGQFELSGAMLENMHETCGETDAHLKEVKTVAEDMGLGFLGLGFQPLWRRDDMPWMPKGRYDIMRDYMPKVGSLGLDMMLRTCTVQANLDFASEADMVKKFRVSLALQPIATALFANSPFTEGKPNGFLSYRAHVWTDTDPDRTGMLAFVFEEGFGFERYVDYLLDVPMYFIYRDGKYIDCAGLSFRDFMAGKLPACPASCRRMKDWADHVTTVFTEVRLKRYLEMRGADGGPWTASARCRRSGPACCTTTRRSTRPGTSSRTSRMAERNACATACRRMRWSFRSATAGARTRAGGP